MKNKVLKPILITFAFITTFGVGFAFSKILSSPAKTLTMKKVTGIGGVFFKCKDPQKMREWYSKNLGLRTDKYGTTFEWRQGAEYTKKGFTQWSPFSAKTKYFEPSNKDFMINYLVENLDMLVIELKKEGVYIVDTIETYDYGKFVHIMT